MYYTGEHRLPAPEDLWSPPQSRQTADGNLDDLLPLGVRPGRAQGCPTAPHKGEHLARRARHDREHVSDHPVPGALLAPQLALDDVQEPPVRLRKGRVEVHRLLLVGCQECLHGAVEKAALCLLVGVLGREVVDHRLQVGRQHPGPLHPETMGAAALPDVLHDLVLHILDALPAPAPAVVGATNDDRLCYLREGLALHGADLGLRQGQLLEPLAHSVPVAAQVALVDHVPVRNDRQQRAREARGRAELCVRRPYPRKDPLRGEARDALRGPRDHEHDQVCEDAGAAATGRQCLAVHPGDVVLGVGF
mmetsp:Transcript_86916/g.230997  ORF Transcript_86916/g.230997 Transcript_86916/m.230997 type:complete len:306 (+) Transcript_86916:212-1129(+)